MHHHLLNLASFSFWKFGTFVLGDYLPIDIPGDASNISALSDSSVDFVLHSHVWEHIPDPLSALVEWVRVVRNSGYLFILVPHRKALVTDVSLPLTTVKEMIHFKAIKATVEFREKKIVATHRGHYNRFSTEILLGIQHWFNEAKKSAKLELVAYLEMDDKIQLGHQICWRVVKKK